MTAAPGEADPTPGVRQLFGAVKQEFVSPTMVAGIRVTYILPKSPSNNRASRAIG